MWGAMALVEYGGPSDAQHGFEPCFARAAHGDGTAVVEHGELAAVAPGLEPRDPAYVQDVRTVDAHEMSGIQARFEALQRLLGERRTTAMEHLDEDFQRVRCDPSREAILEEVGDRELDR